jgi:hypothetical protein
VFKRVLETSGMGAAAVFADLFLTPTAEVKLMMRRRDFHWSEIVIVTHSGRSEH